MKMTALILTLILALTLCATACAATGEPCLSDVYPTTFVVCELDYEADVVTVIDFDGHLFTFYGCRDWCIGDVISADMWSNGTCLDVTDDVILTVELSGWFTPEVMAYWMAH